MNRPQIVADTLRQLAWWGAADRTPTALLELATLVEGEDYAGCLVCPMCQELDCDLGCPLAGVRS